MKTRIMIYLFPFLWIGCGTNYWKYGGEGAGIRTASFPDPAPYGMVLIPKGSIILGAVTPEPLWDIPLNPTEASFNAFWMDQTEVTNARYRQFVYWVRDSIIWERLYDPLYGGDEYYKITEDRYGEPVKPYLDWNRPIPWNRPSEEEKRAIESIYTINPVTGEKSLHKKQLNYRYEWYDHRSAIRYRKELDNPSLHNKPFISKDTAYIDEKGEIVTERITRPLSGYADFLHTYIVNVYPDESCWITDFPDSENDRYSRHYFNHGGYDHYPVVGVSWDMATAYCAWRTQMYRSSVRIPEGQIVEPFRLPTEAEWEYAARSGKNEYIYPWGATLKENNKCFPGNFKPTEGNYTMDGHLITAPVRSYPANLFGLYDMAGNVAEWTTTQSGERYVIKGGSWKDIPFFVRSTTRNYEYPDQTRSYIGFRCVRNYAGATPNKR